MGRGEGRVLMTLSLMTRSIMRGTTSKGKRMICQREIGGEGLACDHAEEPPTNPVGMGAGRNGRARSRGGGATNRGKRKI
jgi:hypothetical protein